LEPQAVDYWIASFFRGKFLTWSNIKAGEVMSVEKSGDFFIMVDGMALELFWGFSNKNTGLPNQSFYTLSNQHR
jgi:hypothetical protein